MNRIKLAMALGWRDIYEWADDGKLYGTAPQSNQIRRLPEESALKKENNGNTRNQKPAP